MIWRKKIKAGALQLVLSIGAIVAVLLLTFVLLAHTHNLFQKKTEVTLALIQEADRALEHSFQKNMNPNEVLELPLDKEWGIQAEVTKKFWGLLEVRKAKANKGKVGFTKLAIVGGQDPGLSALYLADHQRPLVLAGDAKITGTAFLPERGAKMGNIGGNGYRRRQLIFGQQKKSQGHAPRLSEEVVVQLKKCTGGFVASNGELIPFEPNMQLKNNFTEPTQIIQGEVLKLQNLSFVGNIVIEASRQMIIEPTAHLQDIMLIAPKITFKPGFQGNVQAFASRSITLDKGCQLAYPSVLAVVPDHNHLNQHQLEPHIFLNKSAEVRGHLVYWDEGTPNPSVPHISIEKGATVIGEVYSSQNVELRGRVVGNVTTNGLVALENGSIYQNHLYQGQIDVTTLPLEYGGLVYENQFPEQIIKWLY